MVDGHIETLAIGGEEAIQPRLDAHVYVLLFSWWSLARWLLLVALESRRVCSGRSRPQPRAWRPLRHTLYGALGLERKRSNEQRVRVALRSTMQSSALLCIVL